MFSTKNCVRRHAHLGQFGADLVERDLADLLVVAGQVEHRDLRGAERIDEARHDHVAELVRDLVQLEGRVGRDQLLQERAGVGDLEGIAAERPQPHRAELRVADHDGVLRAPLLVGPLPRRDEVDLALERRLEAVLPAEDGGEDRDVVGVERVHARRLDVGELPFLDEPGRLPLADDELRAVLDLVLVAGEAVGQDFVLARLGPLDDVDELAANPITKSHDGPPDWVRMRDVRRDMVAGNVSRGNSNHRVASYQVFKSSS